MRKGLLAPQNTFLDTIAERFDGSHSNFVLGNAQIPDQYPIVYCSDGFCELSGLPRCKVMRRSCAIRFVYGEDTRQDIKERIERALRNKEEYRVEVKFHFYSDRESRDQTSQSCQLDIVPIKNETGTVVFFLISVKDISKSNPKINFAREREGRDLKEWRRRSRAILYNISGNIGNISSAGFMKSSQGRDDVESRTSAKKSAISEALGRSVIQLATLRQFREQQKNDIPEYKMASRMPYGVVLHCGTFRSTWDLLIFICTIYVAALVPYQSVFKDSDYDLQTAAAKNDLSMINRSFDVFVEAVFIFDVILNFRTTFVSKSGNVVFNPSLISRNYIRSWFLIDLFAAIPIDLFTLFINFPPDTSTSASNSANDIQVSLNNVQMLKILRLLRLARVAYKLELLTQYGAIALTVSVLIFGMMAHWLACVWYLIGWNELNNLNRVSNDTRKVGWLYELSNSLQREYVVEVTNFSNQITGEQHERVWNKHGPTMVERYTTSLYFTLSSLTSVGFGNVSANTNNEKVFSVLVMLIGALMHAVVFGNVTAIIQRMYARRSQYDTRMRDMKEFFTFAQIDKNLQRRLIDYFNATWSKRKGMQQVDSTLQTFPANLRGEIFQHLHSQFLNLPVFQYTSPSCRNFIALRVQRMFFTPDEFLVYEGDSLSHIYLVISGSMEVSRDGQITAIFGKGDLFGYDPKEQLAQRTRTSACRSSANVRALSYCDLQYISASTFHQLCKLFPEFTKRFINELSSDYSCNLWELHEPVKESMSQSSKRAQIPSVTEAVEKNHKSQSSNCYDDENLKASSDVSDQENMPLLDGLSGWSPEIEGDKSDDDSSSVFAGDSNLASERLRWFSDPLTLGRKSSKRVTWSDDCSRRSSAPVIWPTKDDDKATESQTSNRDDHVKTLTENVAVLSDRLTVLHKDIQRVFTVLEDIKSSPQLLSPSSASFSTEGTCNIDSYIEIHDKK